MNRANILFVTDDIQACQLLARSLPATRLQAVIVNATGKALARLSHVIFDLVVIDIYQDNLDGIEVCRQLWPQTQIPILLLEHDGKESRAVQSYEAGADDYIAAPIGPRLFRTKILYWLRRAQQVPTVALAALEVDGFRLDPIQQQLTMPDGGEVDLAPLEFRLLYLLMSNQGRIVSKDSIIDFVWGSAAWASDAALKSVLHRLRRKIEPDPKNPRYIQNVWGRGWLFQVE